MGKISREWNGKTDLHKFNDGGELSHNLARLWSTCRDRIKGLFRNPHVLYTLVNLEILESPSAWKTKENLTTCLESLEFLEI